jgi:hypothetical protein
LLGASLGWLVGILASPYDPAEESTFGKFAQLIYGFLAGYGFSKFDPVLQNAISGANIDASAVVCVGVVSFLIAVALTYISRRYWAPAKRGSNSGQSRPSDSVGGF